LERFGNEYFKRLQRLGLTVAMQVNAAFWPNRSLFDFALQFFLQAGIEPGIVRGRGFGGEICLQIDFPVSRPGRRFPGPTPCISIDTVTMQAPDSGNQPGEFRFVVIIHLGFSDQIGNFANIIRKCSQTYIQII
jgi:hypothetical protein